MLLVLPIVLTQSTQLSVVPVVLIVKLILVYQTKLEDFKFFEFTLKK